MGTRAVARNPTGELPPVAAPAPAQRRRPQRGIAHAAALAALVVVAATRGLFWVAIIDVWRGDEHQHYSYIQDLAEGRGLPVLGVDRITDEVAEWAAAHPGIYARPGAHLGADPRIAQLVLDRYREAVAGDGHMNCDLCVYRHQLPGYEHRHHRHPEEVIEIGEPHNR